MTYIQVERVYINTHTISHRSGTDVLAFRPYLNGVFKWTIVVFVLKQINCCCMCRPVLVTPHKNTHLCWCNRKSKQCNYIRNMTSELFINKLSSTKSLFCCVEWHTRKSCFLIYFYTGWMTAQIHCYTVF